VIHVIKPVNEMVKLVLLLARKTAGPIQILRLLICPIPRLLICHFVPIFCFVMVDTMFTSFARQNQRYHTHAGVLHRGIENW
jgi:hypothetical protein